MQTKLTPTVEDYLSILWVLERDGEPVIGARLAEILGVTPPTVTNTLKRMMRNGLIAVDQEKGFCLTEQGRQAAQSVMRRHMLTEWLLLRMLDWSKTHSQAHTIEHTVSVELEEALRNNLENPQLCPHGNPLPGYEHVVVGWQPLLSFSSGATVIIRRVHELAEQNPELLAFLEEHQVMPGKAALITEILPFNETITLQIEGQAVTLGYIVARYIFAEPA
ncbi:MAG: metal-dependent transcriptional regulator [Anaerolineales bacterium]|nr:metal-dependent transcriptional regulator [Anaerolineales bacterium]MCS7248359.1 metal-dependent transcriptional regulator [Anaerolineales bacterium]MDW8162172.1 metal-dependent transcriptional regulator [Anaerolineales bacterium]MDW8446727.1 metal-dependent transcriptional regulator [Anaerolineales bacterium]